MTNTYIEQLANLVKMLQNLDRDLNLVAFNETEKKIYYTIAYEIHNKGKCNISDVIESSGFSRSTVYKAIKVFEDKKMIKLIQSGSDRREVFLNLLTARLPIKNSIYEIFCSSIFDHIYSFNACVHFMVRNNFFNY